jgi:hypothetical protein
MAGPGKTSSTKKVKKMQTGEQVVKHRIPSYIVPASKQSRGRKQARSRGGR